MPPFLPIVTGLVGAFVGSSVARARHRRKTKRTYGSDPGETRPWVGEAGREAEAMGGAAGALVGFYVGWKIAK